MVITSILLIELKLLFSFNQKYPINNIILTYTSISNALNIKPYKNPIKALKNINEIIWFGVSTIDRCYVG